MSPASINKLRRMAREAGPTIARSTNKALRASGELGRTAARNSVLGPPPVKADQRSHAERRAGATYRMGRNRAHSGLRAGIAAGTRVALGTSKGIRIASTSTSLPVNQKGMNRVYQRPSFRHPVFGNRNAWANQHGKDWFYGPILKVAVPMRESIAVAVTVAAEELSKGV